MSIESDEPLSVSEWPWRQLEKLCDCLSRVADDLEASVKAEYRDVLDYPSMKRKYERDMEPVVEARRLIVETRR